jgi:L-alanine-DL-glutamate epimerase-like enolase superfamily enzyme
VLGRDPFATGTLWAEQQAAVRNLGRRGLSAMALSAVDIALWDLKAKLLGVPLFRLLGPFRDSVPVYGSGGFCNYPQEQLRKQLEAWREAGIPRVKVKTSRTPEDDPKRLALCREVGGDRMTLMADANGALSRKAALYWAQRFHDEWNVSWFEEPVSSDDRDGLRLIRDRAPAGLDIAAGEYGFVLRDFADLLEAGAVDCLQADVTRCGGITGFLQVAGLCAAAQLELSGHCAPAVSAHALCAAPALRHLEYFHDHARIESMLFDGTLSPSGGAMKPDPSRPGLGLTFKERDAERYRVFLDAA